MDTEPDHSEKEATWPSLRDAMVSALRDMPPADKAEKNERRLLSGSALGVCLASMLAMLSLPRLDDPLHVALIALAVATPLLIIDFIYAPARPKHGAVYYLRLGLWIAAWIIGDGIGIGAVVVGIVAILWHLYPTAVRALVWSLVGSAALLLCLALPITLFLGWRRLRADKKKQKETPEKLPSSD